MGPGPKADRSKDLGLYRQFRAQENLLAMRPTRTYPPATPRDLALADVTSTGSALRRTRLARAPLADVRKAFAAAEDAFDAALDLVQASVVTDRPLVRRLQTARDLLVLQRRGTEGMDLPDCAQTTSLDADGPHTAGLDFARVDPHGPGADEVHGLDLVAALEPATRAVAGRLGPQATHQQQALERWTQEPRARRPSINGTLPRLS